MNIQAIKETCIKHGQCEKSQSKTCPLIAKSGHGCLLGDCPSVWDIEDLQQRIENDV